MECFTLLFEEKDLIECKAWDYQLHDYFIVPVSSMYLNGIGPLEYFVNEYESYKDKVGRTLVHKYLAELDDDHVHMRIRFEIKSWMDPDSFFITSDNLAPLEKTIYLFDEVINTLKDTGQIPENFNFQFDDSVGSGNYCRHEERSKLTEEDIELTDWDAADDFESEEEMRGFLELVLSDDSLEIILNSINAVARAKGNKKIARQANSLQGKNPSYKTINKMLNNIGFNWDKPKVTVLGQT